MPYPIIEHPAPSVLKEMHRAPPNPLPRDFEVPYHHPMEATEKMRHEQAQPASQRNSGQP